MAVVGGVRKRRTGVRAALEILEARGLLEGIRGEVVLVKPNCVSSRNQLAATHAEALEAVLEAVTAHRPRKVILGEGSAADTWEAFRNFGYIPVAKRYGAELLDLNADETVELPAYGAQGEEIPVRVSRTALESFRVSVALPKTHDTVIVTLSLKNMVMGAIHKGDKWTVHQGYPAINVSLAALARHLLPHVGVIDGAVGMEGDGPLAGSPVEHGVALAGNDPVALDGVMAYLMGFDPQKIGYLVHAASLGLGTLGLSGIELVSLGAVSLKELVRPYRPHRAYREQLHWSPTGTPLEGILSSLGASRG